MRKKKLLVSAVLLALPVLASAEGESGKIQMGGVVEVEAAAVDDAGEKSSDIAVSTVELSFDAQMNERVAGHILLLHEEDDTPLEVAEATITVHMNGEHSAYLTAGQAYLPFGRFETQMVSDPMTLDLGEARETVLQVSFDSDGLTANAYMYNGEVAEAEEDDKVANYGANLGFVFEKGSYSFDLGVSYISNIADSSGFKDALPDNDADDAIDPIDSFVSGKGAHAIIGHGAWKAIFEYIQAGQFDSAVFAYKDDGAAPRAWNIELGYALDGKSTLAAGYQASQEAAAMELLETKQLIAYSREIYDATTLAVEYAQGEYYAVDDGGSGEDWRALTARLAVSF